MKSSASVDACVVGAGFAGLAVARSLEQSGADYVVLDKGRSPGGRAATRRIGEAQVDHGIPWLTRTGGLSDGLIDGFREAGLVERRFAGGSAGDIWASPEGINSLAKHLAAGLNLRYSHRVESVAAGDPNRLHVAEPENGRYELEAREVIITAPVPQTIEMAPSLAGEIGVAEPGEIYSKAVIGLARLRQSSYIPEQLLFENPAPGICRVILESLKFPGRPPSVSIRCDAGTSRRIFDLPDEESWQWMAESIAHLALLEAEPAERQIKRWRYSQPANPVPLPFVSIETAGGSLSACGDGFDTGAETGLESALGSAHALMEARGIA